MTMLARIAPAEPDERIKHIVIQSYNVCGVIQIDQGGDEVFTTLIPWCRVLDLNSQVDGEIQSVMAL